MSIQDVAAWCIVAAFSVPLGVVIATIVTIAISAAVKKLGGGR